MGGKKSMKKSKEEKELELESKKESVASTSSVGGDASTWEQGPSTSAGPITRKRGSGDADSSSCEEEDVDLKSKKKKKTKKKSRKDKEEKPKEKKEGALEALKENICLKFRVMVSQNRRRIHTDGFDLDLTYITDRIIAMGYPAEATEQLYRNSMRHITRFLEKRHPGHYKVFNLRGQYSYDPANFKHRVISFEMTDHHPPRLELMAPFCREVHEWLMADKRNIVAVHCKAGKGRTGVMICAYLAYCMFYPSPRQNMDYYSVVRTRNNKGVTIPSQRRYVYYYDHLRKHNLNYLPPRVQLIGVYMEKPPHMTATGAAKVLRSSSNTFREKMTLRVANGDVDVFKGAEMDVTDVVWAQEDKAWAGNVTALGPDSYDPINPEEGKDILSRRAYGWTVPKNKPVFLEGDVRIDMYSKKKMISVASKKLGHIWFNTMFCCPGACSEPYVHGDEAHPYPEGETTIARKKKRTTARGMPIHGKSMEFEVGVPSAGPPTGREGETTGSSLDLGGDSCGEGPSTSALSAPSTSSPLSPVGSGSPGAGQSSPSTTSTSPSKKGRKKRGDETMSSRLSGGFARVRSFFSSESSRARASATEQSAPSSSRPSSYRHSNPEALTRATTSNRPSVQEEEEELEILDPPGLDSHCDEEGIKLIYHDNGRVPPRHAIGRMLKDAHKKGLVTDTYNTRRLSVPSEGEPVECGLTGRPSADGPNRIVREPSEHVSYFPLVEIDRLFKDENVDAGFKLIVVTKCVGQNEAIHAEAFMNVTYDCQDNINKNIYERSQKGKSYVDTERKYVEYGSGRTWPPVIQYGNVGMQGSGGEAPTLSDHVYVDDPRARDDRLCRYFHKQRKDSISTYPQTSHRCPLLPSMEMESSMHSSRLGASSSDVQRDRSTTPQATRSRTSSQITATRSPQLSHASRSRTSSHATSTTRSRTSSQTGTLIGEEVPMIDDDDSLTANVADMGILSPAYSMEQDGDSPSSEDISPPGDIRAVLQTVRNYHPDPRGEGWDGNETRQSVGSMSSDTENEDQRQTTYNSGADESEVQSGPEYTYNDTFMDDNSIFIPGWYGERDMRMPISPSATSAISIKEETAEDVKAEEEAGASSSQPSTSTGPAEGSKSPKKGGRKGK